MRPLTHAAQGDDSCFRKVASPNNLQVLPDSNYDDELRIAIARAIYNDPYFIHYADQSHPPLPIIVDNGNVTFEGVVASVMDGALLPRQNPCPAKQSRAK